MFRISRFAELLKPLSRGVFDRAVADHQADRYRKKFDCWQQLVTMTYAQFSGASSLRVLERSFNAQSAHHYHLGCGEVKRSTLADMNAKGTVSVFSKVTEALMQPVPKALRQDAQPWVRLLDSTHFTLTGPGFDEWTKATRTPRTQGMKLHLLLGLNERAPLSHAFTAANVNDIEHAWTLPIEKGVTYVFDKGYCNYSWWWRIERSQSRFVTRFKRNANLLLLTKRPIARPAAGVILSDQIVKFNNRNPGAGRHTPYTTSNGSSSTSRSNGSSATAKPR